MPLHHFEPVVASYIAAQNLGVLICAFESQIMPADDDTDALRTTDRWLIWYVYFPVALQALIILCLVTIVKHEPIKFLISKNRLDEARKAVR